METGLAEGDIVMSLDGQLLESVAQLEQLLEEVDDDRTPKVFEVWRPLEGAEAVDPADDLDAWLDAHERLKIAVRPEVR